ncbi:MAG: hypothetical protein KC492_00185 [Myxococcales bacterium]|nr:hypothetical protein [Myxococcales bacterium]
MSDSNPPEDEAMEQELADAMQELEEEGVSLPELSEDEENELRSLIRGALAEKQESDAPDVLAGVQKKLRERSGGKFFRDGWSTSQEAPIATYLVTSALMLVVLLLVYAVLGPLSGEAIKVDMQPAPVQVLPSPPANPGHS